MFLKLFDKTPLDIAKEIDNRQILELFADYNNKNDGV